MKTEKAQQNSVPVEEGMTSDEEELDVPLLSVDTNYPNPNVPLHLDHDGLLQLTANSFVSTRTIALGQSGAGKGNAGSLVNELLLEHGLPMTILDPEGEAWPLKQLAKNLLVVGKSAHADREYAPEQMGRLAELSVEQGFSVILDLDEYSEAEIFGLLVPYLNSLWKTCNRLRRPYHLSIDEVHEFVPQQGSTPVKDLLIRIAKKGRKRGLGMLTMSQDTASIDDKFLRQTDIRILLRVSYDSDLKRYQTLMPAIPNKTIDHEVPKMPQGKGYVIVNHIPTLVQLLRRRTFDPSETPKLGVGAQEPVLHTVDDSTLRLLDESIPALSEFNLESADRATLIERIAELTRTRTENGSPTSTAPSAEQERTIVAQNQQLTALHQQVKTLQEQLSQREQDITRLHQEEHTTNRAHKEQLATLRTTIAGLEKDCESLKGQLHLASQLTVSLTGLPSLEPLLAATHSLRVQKAHVEQVSLGSNGSSKHTPRRPNQSEPHQDTAALRQLQAILDAFAERVARLTQADAETKQLRGDLARLTQQSSASVMPAALPGKASSLRPHEQRKLDRLIELIMHLPHASFQCTLLTLLLAHEGQDLSYPEIARALHYEVGTVRNRTTTGLQKEGLIARATSVIGYTSRFAAYCDKRFPGVDQEVIRTALVAALVPQTEEQGVSQ